MISLSEREDAPFHLDAISRLAQELALPEEVVAERYACELAALQEGARIDDYLILLTARRVRRTLLAAFPGRKQLNSA